MNFHLNKILKLRIREKLAIAFVGLSIVPVLVVGILGISSNVKALRELAVANLDQDLQRLQERLNTFFQGMEDNIHFITSSTSFQHFLEALKEDDQRRIVRTESELLPELIEFAQYKNIFYQIKFLDNDGDEVFKIQNLDHQYRVQSLQNLDSTGTQFYLYLAKDIPANRATFIPVELQTQQGIRLLPAISCIYPISSDQFLGILIFHIYAQNFFQVIEQQAAHFPKGTVMLMNKEGYYLYHSERKKEWNKLLASQETLNLTADYGQTWTRHLLSKSSQRIYEINNEIIAHAPVFIWHEGMKSEYTILKSVSKTEIFASVNNYKKIFLTLLGVFLFISLWLSYSATHQITEAINKLKREASVIAKGDYHSRVDVRTYDEIEDLARQFNIMAESLQQHEFEVSEHRESLEQKVQERTQELQNEKNKLQIILDNVPSAFVLLDKECNILSASAALENITSKKVETLIGRSCYEVTGCYDNQSECIAAKAFQSRQIETQIQSRQGPNGEDRYVEYVSVPLKNDGRVENVLEIITDVTDRKRLQDQLIRSERLATTGEIAAVIAHEMRNSLTSVRMILQLLNEVENINASDRESLVVALDSLARMERVVNDLLQLARPAQLNKQSVNINDIVVDSIELAKHQISADTIHLTLDLDPHLPKLLVDATHLKEAIVNLILNAAQAIEQSGKITIRSELVRLKKELRDLGDVSVADAEETAVGVKEVVIKRNVPVAQIVVIDSGCGIPSAHIKRIFDPFFTTKINGTGLGLSFVKRVVNEHQGIVTVESQVNKGTRFSILIPVHNDIGEVKA